MDKLQVAHDYYMQHIKLGKYVSEGEAWAYADNMFCEMDLRKEKTLPDALWQPDWSLAPDDAVACAMDSDLEMWWCSYQPVSLSISWDSNSKISEYINHNYTGDWRNSLRIRPQGK